MATMIEATATRPRRPGSVLALGALGLGLLGVTAVARPVPLIIENASASAPLGFYRVLPARPIRRGDLVLAWAPPAARRLAARRFYLPATVPLVKRVAALAGDTVCADGAAVRINGWQVATRLPADREGRPLPAWSGCRTLGPDQVFLLMAAVPDSFDGRYFGPIGTRAVIGRLVPLWTW